MVEGGVAAVVDGGGAAVVDGGRVVVVVVVVVDERGLVNVGTLDSVGGGVAPEILAP